MRTSKKVQLIDAAIAIVEKHGIAAVTYESLAEASGLSKSGLIYHFPTRNDLLNSINNQLAAAWEAEMEAVAGGTAEEVSELTRLRAAFLVMSQSATLADLRMTLEGIQHPEMMEPWFAVMRRWCRVPDSIAQDPDGYLIQVIADGLWVHDHVNEFPLSSTQRMALVNRALELISH